MFDFPEAKCQIQVAEDGKFDIGVIKDRVIHFKCGFITPFVMENVELHGGLFNSVRAEYLDIVLS